MEISLRSQLITGAVTVLTVGTVTFGAVASPVGLPVLHVPTAAEIELAAYQYGHPLLELFDTLQQANLYLFSIEEPPVTEFDRAGIVPDFLAAGFPIVTQYALNASDYVNQVGNYLFADSNPQNDVYPGAFRVLAWAGAALPVNLGLALQQTFSGQWLEALWTLQFAVLNPIQAAAYQVLNLGLYELGGVAARAAAVFTAIAEWVPKAIRALADDVTVVGKAVLNTIGTTIYELQRGRPDRAVAQLFHGLFGVSDRNSFPELPPNTIPDALINQTIGEGGFINTAPPGDIPDFPGREAPSIRQNLIELRDKLAEALATDVPVPETPPFAVRGWVGGAPVQSAIPTPWKPTPYAGPAAAVRAAASEANVAASALAAVEADDNSAAAARRPARQGKRDLGHRGVPASAIANPAPQSR